MFRKPQNQYLNLDTLCETCGQRYGEHSGDDCPEEFEQEDKMTDLHDLMHKYPKETRMEIWWECYVEGTDGGKHYHHWSLQSAKTEAERLARLTGGTVYVFECIGKCKSNVEWETPTLW
jgi:hypothetical protein